jgi:hypothetical protein
MSDVTEVETLRLLESLSSPSILRAKKNLPLQKEKNPLIFKTSNTAPLSPSPQTKKSPPKRKALINGFSKAR